MFSSFPQICVLVTVLIAVCSAAPPQQEKVKGKDKDLDTSEFFWPFFRPWGLWGGGWGWGGWGKDITTEPVKGLQSRNIYVSWFSHKTNQCQR